MEASKIHQAEMAESKRSPGRPTGTQRKPAKVQCGIWINPQLMADLKAESKQSGVPLTDIFTEALGLWLSAKRSKI